MLAERNLGEYLDEIRREVCSRCPERPPGGPPCAPLGKVCGVEMHLPQLIDSIHVVHSDRIAPYLAHNRMEICTHCDFLHQSLCPCPMDYLTVLVVEAVEAVDERLEEKKRQPPAAACADMDRVGLAEVWRAYEEGLGTWRGCDWPTRFGASELELNGCTAAEAEAMAVASLGLGVVEDWRAAARWLGRVEEYAREAQEQAGAAVRAAADGQWEEALRRAYLAWTRELSTGRPLRKAKAAWKNLLVAVQSAYRAHQEAPSEATECKTS